MIRLRKNKILILLALSIMLLVGCSPEAERTRGGGPGADIRNRGPVVRLHDGANPAYKVPEELPPPWIMDTSEQ